jgi:hypothetical protein
VAKKPVAKKPAVAAVAAACGATRPAGGQTCCSGPDRLSARRRRCGRGRRRRRRCWRVRRRRD